MTGLAAATVPSMRACCADRPQEGRSQCSCSSSGKPGPTARECSGSAWWPLVGPVECRCAGRHWPRQVLGQQEWLWTAQERGREGSSCPGLAACDSRAIPATMHHARLHPAPWDRGDFSHARGCHSSIQVAFFSNSAYSGFCTLPGQYRGWAAGHRTQSWMRRGDRCAGHFHGDPDKHDLSPFVSLGNSVDSQRLPGHLKDQETGNGKYDQGQCSRC